MNLKQDLSEEAYRTLCLCILSHLDAIDRCYHDAAWKLEHMKVERLVKQLGLTMSLGL